MTNEFAQVMALCMTGMTARVPRKRPARISHGFLSALIQLMGR
jgi:hypothetical protein